MLTLSALWALTFKLLLPALLLVAIVDVLTQSPHQRIRRLYRSGRYSQRALADRLGITRYAVRSALA
jgi:DNA-binding MarR family transcriptional regulator